MQLGSLQLTYFDYRGFETDKPQADYSLTISKEGNRYAWYFGALNFTQPLMFCYRGYLTQEDANTAARNFITLYFTFKYRE